MHLTHWENKARQFFWVVHVEAWRRSDLARSNYCDHHHLNRRTFKRWLDYLMGKDAARKHAEYQAELRREERLKAREKKPRRRQKVRFCANTDVRNKALQAFWAMHVEAMNWSGMGLSEYASAMFLSPHSLRCWRNRLDDGEVEIDWRAHLHPSARPVVRDVTNGNPAESRLTAPPDSDPPAPARPARRFFSDEQKRAIVRESEARGVTVSAIARKHGITAGLLFRWRAEFGVAPKQRAQLATVVLPADQPATQVLQGLMQTGRTDNVIAAPAYAGEAAP